MNGLPFDQIVVDHSADPSSGDDLNLTVVASSYFSSGSSGLLGCVAIRVLGGPLWSDRTVA
jgi:hypothetical protein